MEKLKSILDSFKGRFFTLEEFPLLSREERPQNVLDDAMKLQESAVRSYAVGLTGKELEGLILELQNPLNTDQILRASQILIARITPRIWKLLTVLYQYHDNSTALNNVLKAVSIQAEERGDSPREAAFIRYFGAVEDKIGAFCVAIEERERDIERCFDEFSVIRKSPFAKKAALAFLETTSKEGLLNNLKWIVATVENHEKEELRCLFTNYLSGLSLEEFHDGINLSIMKKIGQPYLSPDWSGYDKQQRDKFAQWCYLHQLKLHSIGFPRKFAILRKYYDQVRSSYEIKEENLMIIDFGDIVVADIEDYPYSFFYEKYIFEMEMAEWVRSREAEAAWLPEADEDEERPQVLLPAFLRQDKKNATARDFIIEEREESCVKLSYDGVDILYIQEMLDIKMGLEPDLRRKQLARLKKEHSRK